MINCHYLLDHARVIWIILIPNGALSGWKVNEIT